MGFGFTAVLRIHHSGIGVSEDMKGLAQALQVSPVHKRAARAQGVVYVLAAAVLWGLSGTASQVLFHRGALTAGGLTAIRMTSAGLILLGVVTARRGVWAATEIWRSRSGALRLLVFALVGLMGVQYAYLAAIAHSNAATATLLQYLGPVVIVLYLALVHRRFPERTEQFAVVLALSGTYLLVTNGRLGGLSISWGGLVWGLVAAGALAFYTLHPKSLLATYGSATVVAWALTIGGLVMSCYARVWSTSGSVFTTESTAALLVFVSLGGTLLAFYLYLSSMRWLSASETGLLACAEPLSAALAAVLVLHVHMGMGSIVGGLCILATVALLARQAKETR